MICRASRKEITDSRGIRTQERLLFFPAQVDRALQLSGFDARARKHSKFHIGEGNAQFFNRQFAIRALASRGFAFYR